MTYEYLYSGPSNNDIVDIFFCFSLTRGRVCGRQQKKSKQKNILYTRGCRFEVPLNTRWGLTRTPHGKKHTLNASECSFEYHWTREGTLHARHTVHSKVQKHINALKRRYTLCKDVQLHISCRCQIRCLSVLCTKGTRFFLFLAESPAAYTRSAT